MVNDMLTATGWTDPILGNTDMQHPTFRPNKIISGKEWEQELIEKSSEYWGKK